MYLCSIQKRLSIFHVKITSIEYISENGNLIFFLWRSLSPQNVETTKIEFETIMEKFVETFQTIYHTVLKKEDGFVSQKGTWLKWAKGMGINFFIYSLLF